MNYLYLNVFTFNNTETHLNIDSFTMVYYS